MQIQKTILVVLTTALAYVGLSSVNSYAFTAFDMSASAPWVFLPSGLRILSILLFVEWGSLGVVLGAMLMGWGQVYGEDPALAFGIAVISGLAPLVARSLCMRYAALKENLEGLPGACLLRLTLVFCAISALMQQAWLAYCGRTSDVLQGMATHFTGELLGALLLLYSAKFVLDRLPQVDRG
jgi:hypothetical protein